VSRASTDSAADFIPPRATLSKLRAAAAGCRGCDLWRYSTQTVFGEGYANARVMFVGEQPGDEEDKAGLPFVGPSGRLLDAALEAAGIARDSVYVTNAVKHFKFVPHELTRRRLHKKPGAAEVRACRPWLLEEIRLVEPELIVALGSTAAQALMGKSFRVTEERGKVLESEWGQLIATVHPSAVLRAPPDVREQARRDFFHDVARVARHLGPSKARRPRSDRAAR
jgi:uracil-DNA glycosylase